MTKPENDQLQPDTLYGPALPAKASIEPTPDCVIVATCTDCDGTRSWVKVEVRSGQSTIARASAPNEPMLMQAGIAGLFRAFIVRPEAWTVTS